ncbi:MAG: hypothetical protein NVSMB56_03520 [Pyrinomonadaceae bacterium]
MPRRTEFIADLQMLEKNVVVNAPGWEQQLENNKRSLAAQWVERAEFHQRFDSVNNEQFVNALFANGGIIATQQEHDALVDNLNNGTDTRATVLRKVSENQNFFRKEFNAAFVLMQYFGYLHRNPDEGADTNMSGYNFWLDKLNQFSGDFQRAEMVRAFILSNEYRHRFDW